MKKVVLRSQASMGLYLPFQETTQAPKHGPALAEWLYLIFKDIRDSRKQRLQRS